MSRRVNDGDRSGIKQDRFRYSEYETERPRNDYSGVTHSSPNTLGGPFNENRGPRFGNPDLRENSEAFYRQETNRGFRNHGGSQIGHDMGHSGRGPRGYKRSDDSIYYDVCDILTLSPDVDAREIEVSVKEGIVYLNGSVPDRETKKLAELDIENVSGVIDVQNLLNFGEINEELH